MAIMTTNTTSVFNHRFIYIVDILISISSLLTPGTTYWIDFQSLGESDSGIDEPGLCANRNAEDYKDLTFDQWWNYTTDPSDLEEVANEDRMAYPPSDWTLDGGASCNIIEYERTFSWNELAACSDAEGNSLVEMTQRDNQIVLSGTFFVELVSPYR